MNAAQLLFTSIVCGVTLRVLGFADRAWLAADDLAKVLEYRSSDSVRVAFSRHKDALAAHSVLAKIDSEGHEVRLFDYVAVRYFCEHAKRPGAVALWRWLNDGGMGRTIDLSAFEEYAKGLKAPITPATVDNVVAFKAPDATSPAGRTERQKAYCRELLKTLLRYATKEETEELVHTIETEVIDLLNHRHCPGLNDARYELFRRFWLQGGDV
ncbi:MAG: hypothetical protein Q8R10_16955 [Pseudomonas sp.]|uniref:hypothetical protein n=1 Tax=Pseudomonas sp. TaxID=306 RepID=UPI0027362680|nr:hypothetical protein [Pseudomonas sp.]MDP3848106.1 hypothetical protein [Pseudomonas sp.]